MSLEYIERLFNSSSNLCFQLSVYTKPSDSIPQALSRDGSNRSFARKNFCGNGWKINSQIRSQFSITVEDDTEVVVSDAMPSLTLVKKEHANLRLVLFKIKYIETYQNKMETVWKGQLPSITKANQSYFSPIMNSLNFSQFENYHLQRLNQAANIDSNAVIEVDRRSILSSRMRRQVDPNSYNIWPLQLNIPQLAEGPGNPSIMRQVIKHFIFTLNLRIHT